MIYMVKFSRFHASTESVRFEPLFNLSNPAAPALDNYGLGMISIPLISGFSMLAVKVMSSLPLVTSTGTVTT